LPELIFFGLDIGIKVKRTYSYSVVANDVRNKLSYYFNAANRTFHGIISFTDIEEYLTNVENVSTTDTFYNVRGIQNIIIRDVNVLNGVIVNGYGTGIYPYYTIASYTGDNVLRNIQLGYNQFPALSLDNCNFSLET
jgi:hypothetical protein